MKIGSFMRVSTVYQDNISVRPKLLIFVSANFNVYL